MAKVSSTRTSKKSKHKNDEWTRLTILFTTSERAILRINAAREGCSTAEYIRRALKPFLTESGDYAVTKSVLRE